MFGKIKAIRDCVSSRVSAARQEIDNRISEIKNKINDYLVIFFRGTGVSNNSFSSSLSRFSSLACAR